MFDAIVEYGMGQYVERVGAVSAPGGGLVADLRAGWDSHVAYGLDHPAFYVLLYGQIAPGKPRGVTAVAEAMLVELLVGIEREGRLRVTPAEPAAAAAFIEAVDADPDHGGLSAGERSLLDEWRARSRA